MYEGHAQRVLFMCQSPCGNNLVTCAGDKLVKFWSLNFNKNVMIESEINPNIFDLR